MIPNCAFKCHSPAQKLSYFVRSLLNLALYELLPSVYFSVFRAAYERPRVSPLHGILHAQFWCHFELTGFNIEAAPVANLGNSPIDADHTQCHDGGSAAHYIHADEDVAEHLSKKPLAPGEVCHYYKRHHNYGHGQVRHCQGHQKVV